MQHLLRTLTRIVQLLYEAVHAIAVGPVALDCDEGKAALFHESTRDGRAPAIELGGAVRRFAEKDVTGVADPVEERIEIRRRAEWLRRLADRVGER